MCAAVEFRPIRHAHFEHKQTTIVCLFKHRVSGDSTASERMDERQKTNKWSNIGQIASLIFTNLRNTVPIKIHPHGDGISYSATDSITFLKWVDREETQVTATCSFNFLFLRFCWRSHAWEPFHGERVSEMLSHVVCTFRQWRNIVVENVAHSAANAKSNYVSGSRARANLILFRIQSAPSRHAARI